MTIITHKGTSLHLLPEKAIYLEQFRTLLVADVHLGKSEAFQARGIPIPSDVNDQTLDRLRALCMTHPVEQLIILGDLFHSRAALNTGVMAAWSAFLQAIAIDVILIVGNHDRPLVKALASLPITYHLGDWRLDSLLLSHDPHPSPSYLNLCGHIHPCLRLKTGTDSLRLPCFHFDRCRNVLALPAFGEFTGGYEISLASKDVAYVVADYQVVEITSQVHRHRYRLGQG
ncbi:MAG: ligase-associated DNA damage response endonuclease PdeM [Cyanobacteria bacterium]|nr:ligase-associated DNA damage response endonuclease PdeM [Cyanobacteriota bacterium]MDW8200414.1 ligase-associated DNA damage response endonuclease PdeM [Cyanobacteriota bacterium SKYGB_h_bin112]